MTERIARPLRVGVVGCGAISHEHLRHISRSPSADLVAVCDRSPIVSRFARDMYGAPRSYVSTGEMLAVEQLDVVHVITPPHTHASVVDEVLDAGCDVICEKPLAPDADTIAGLLDRARSAGRLLVETRNLLYNDPVARIDQLRTSGALGEVREVDLAISIDLASGPFGDPNLDGPGVGLPGGAVHDMLPHLSYLFLHLAGTNAVDGITGWLRNASENERVGFDSLDAVVAAGSVQGHLRIAPATCPDSFRVRVGGTTRSVETDLYQPYLRIQGGRDVGRRAALEQLRSGGRLALAAFSNVGSKVFDNGTYQGIPRFLEETYDAIRSGTEPPVAADDVLAAARLTDLIVGLATAPAGPGRR